MLILGIETSCDETAVSLVEVYPVKSREAGTLKELFDRVKNGKIKVLSSAVSSQVKLHAKYGGVVPSLAAREHVKNLRSVLELALETGNPEKASGPRGFTGCKLKTIDLIAVTAGPGLISSLLVGTAFAKTLAWRLNKPIVGVNHTEGHIASNWLSPIGKISNFQFPISKKTTRYTLNAKRSPIFPALCLVVSGGHTQLILMKDLGKYKTVGETLDDAAGEAFDKIARILELGYPGGPAISAAAEKLETPKRPVALGALLAGNPEKASGVKPRGGHATLRGPRGFTGWKLETKLPRPMINSKSFDFSFSGLKTAVLYLDRDLKKKLGKNKLPKELISQIAAEAQMAIVDVLVTKTIKAAQKYEAKSIMLSGGVSANKLLRSELQKNAEQREIKYFQPSPEYTTDNAAMIALAGYFNRKSGSGDWKKVKTDANWELT